VSVDQDRFTMEYMIVSEGLGEVAALGGGVVVSYDYDRRAKTAIPDPVRLRIMDMLRRTPAEVGNEREP
jgi:acyl-CoA thioester hydrolase